MPPPGLKNFVVFPPGCGDSLAHEARLRCPKGVSGDMYMKMRYQDGLFKSKSTNYPDHCRHCELPLPGKIPMVEPGIEPGTS